MPRQSVSRCLVNLFRDATSICFVMPREFRDASSISFKMPRQFVSRRLVDQLQAVMNFALRRGYASGVNVFLDCRGIGNTAAPVAAKPRVPERF